MIKANAIGIPVLAIIQGLFATLGYWICGIDGFGFGDFLPGVFSFVPVYFEFQVPFDPCDHACLNAFGRAETGDEDRDVVGVAHVRQTALFQFLV